MTEVEKLRELLLKHGICEDCGEMYSGCYDDPFASCNCKTSEWYIPTPYMKAVNHGLDLWHSNTNMLAVFEPITKTQQAVWSDALKIAQGSAAEWKPQKVVS